VSTPSIDDLIERRDLEGAAAAIVKQLGPGILGYVMSIVRDEDSGREVFSRFCERLWRALPDFRRESSVKTWAYRLAWNSVISYLREPFRRQARPLDDLPASREVALVWSTRTRNRVAQTDLLATIRAELTPEDQTLLVLRYDRDLPWDEIAWILAEEQGEAVKPEALRKRFERLKRTLKARLSQQTV
jgi:RNA polymerase sigma-70 factor (ECF subfamily)